MLPSLRSLPLMRSSPGAHTQMPIVGGASAREEEHASRILVVDDEVATAAHLCDGLAEAGFRVEAIGDGVLALERAKAGGLDLMVLDVGLPRLDGREVLRQLRQAGIPLAVLILTARDGVVDRVAGLEMGADDYLIKPFAFAELLARIRSVLRRGRSPRLATLRQDDLEIDLLERKVTRAGRRIDLSPTEFSLLTLLMRHAGTTLPRRLIAEEVWNLRFDSETNIVEVAITRLRSKVDAPFPRALIQTVRGVGYRCYGDG